MLLLRGHEDYVVGPACDLDIRHIQWLSIYERVDGKRIQLAKGL